MITLPDGGAAAPGQGRRFRACIFDMDGVLLDSEPAWRRAEIEVFGSVGLHLTEEDCLQTMGIGVAEVVALRHSQKPWSAPSQEEVCRRIVDRVADLVRSARPLPGVREAIGLLLEEGVPLALASSSHHRLIETVLEALDLRHAFPVRHSGTEEEFSKPHPAVYLTAARRLGVPPQECLVIEDSVTGVIAAKAARMTVVAVPEPAMRPDPRFALADARLDSLEQFSEFWRGMASHPAG